MKTKTALSTMRAIRIYSYGGPQVMVGEIVPRPEPSTKEVLIAVHAAGVNPIDWKVREGYVKGWLRQKLPLIPGWDVSGVIVELGDGVDGFRKGDEVYGKLDAGRDGAYAEYAVSRVENIALKPRTLDHVHAAAVPTAALTAWQSLFDLARLKAGQIVLIHAAAGGVGHFAVQLSKWRGASVIGTASGRNEEFLRKLGVDFVINYTSRNFEGEVSGVDCVLDTQGGDVLARSLRVLKKGGIVVSTLDEPPAEELARYGVRAAHVITRGDAGQLMQIARLIDAGEIRPVVETVLTLAEARKAHELSQRGHVRGKIVLRIRE